MSEDKNWYKAELNGHEGYIPSNYISMRANRSVIGQNFPINRIWANVCFGFHILVCFVVPKLTYGIYLIKL